MHIATITWQYRRDFQAVYACEHCGNTTEGYGYDDDNFHRNVVPAMQCTACGTVAGPEYRALAARYAADVVV